jgi:hypothetical protein
MYALEGVYVWASSDGGRRWRRLSPTPDTRYGRIQISRRNNRVLYLSRNTEEGGVFRSTDRGRTWRPFGVASLRDRAISDLSLSANETWLYGATGGPDPYSGTGVAVRRLR